jgi:hypothetical protein
MVRLLRRQPGWTGRCAFAKRAQDGRSTIGGRTSLQSRLQASHDLACFGFTRITRGGKAMPKIMRVETVGAV